MGAGVSDWRLASAVCKTGHLGVVSSTGLEQILARRLQDGDPEGHVRRALRHFPFPRLAKRILDTFFVPGGKPADTAYKGIGFHTLEGARWPQEVCMAANFVEVFLAGEGHDNPVGINLLEKIQLPHIPSLYGAMLAGVAVVIMGAGIPQEIPEVLDRLSLHQPASYPVFVQGAPRGADMRTTFDPTHFRESDGALPPLQRPDFLPIVSSATLATMLLRRSSGSIEGFIVEGHRAGGHNAPPRGRQQLTEDGQPLYGKRDAIDVPAFVSMGLPFWLAGSYGSREGLQRALDQGAQGIQAGTVFALCRESGLTPEIKQALVRKALAGKTDVFTDPLASPTGFPFKVAALDGTLSNPEVYRQRQRVCDLGFLRQAYCREDGSVAYRCPAEPAAAFLSKGGRADATAGRKCLCNALIANIGLPQVLADSCHEKCLVTLGTDLSAVRRLAAEAGADYTAAQVVDHLLS